MGRIANMVEELEDQLDTLQVEVDDANDRINVLEGQLEYTQDDVYYYKQLYEESLETISGLEADIETIRERVTK